MTNIEKAAKELQEAYDNLEKVSSEEPGTIEHRKADDRRWAAEQELLKAAKNKYM